MTAPTYGDIRTHVVRVDLSKDGATEQFKIGSKDYIYPWLTGEFVCNGCHNDEGRADSIILGDLADYCVHKICP